MECALALSCLRASSSLRCGCLPLLSFCLSLILVCYGFPPSHPPRRLNEVLLSDVLSYLSGLRRPSIVARDLNDSSQNSATLSMFTAIGAHDLTPHLPITTNKKDGHLSKSMPIDHVIVNKVALDLSHESSH